MKLFTLLTIAPLALAAIPFPRPNLVSVTFSEQLACTSNVGVLVAADWSYVDIIVPEEFLQPYTDSSPRSALPAAGCRVLTTVKYPSRTTILSVEDVTVNLDLHYGDETRLEGIVGVWFEGPGRSGGNWVDFQPQGPRSGPFSIRENLDPIAVAAGQDGHDILAVHFQLVYHGPKNLKGVVRAGSKGKPFVRVKLDWKEKVEIVEP